MIVRNCDSYVGLTNHWVRIAIKDHDTNIKLVDKPDKYFESIGRL